MVAIAHRSIALGEVFHAVSPAALTLRGYAESMAMWFRREANLTYVPCRNGGPLMKRVKPTIISPTAPTAASRKASACCPTARAIPPSMRPTSLLPG
jgi:hypothetical protein